jgi:energy-coupling factor transport system ATP-binding protein
MIRLDRVTVTYPDAAHPTLRDVDLTIAEGELVLVSGRTGAGKSTLLGLLNGLVPHFTGGHLQGTVRIDGTDTRHRAPRELAHLVGVVGQDPLAGFVTDVVEDELAYGMEQLGTSPDTMRTRVEETLDLLGIAGLRRRPLRSLSGGQQQRVAIGSVLTAQPRILVLDEPTSALDPTAAEEVLAAVTRLVHDLGVTVVMAEHRMERVVQYADGMLLLPGDGRRPRSRCHRCSGWAGWPDGPPCRCRCGMRAGLRRRYGPGWLPRRLPTAAVHLTVRRCSRPSGSP